MLTRKTVLLAAAESSYGSEPAGMGATDGILIGNLDLDVDPAVLERDNIRDTLSAYGIKIGKKIVNVSFDVELKGSGSVPASDDPLEYDCLLQACGFTVTYSSGAIYTPTSSEALMDSVTLKFNYDGMQYLVEGCIGNWSMDLKAGEFGVMHFRFMGLYNSPTDVAQVQGTYDESADPPIIQSLTLSWDGWTCVAENFNMDMNNEIAERPDVNSVEGLKGFRITDRRMTATLDPEMELVASYDAWDKFENSTSIAITATVGADAGNKFDISIPTAEYEALKPGDRNGLRIYEATVVCTGDDNELSFTAY